ncbi:MFS transporter [Pseudomonas paraeruginosa]|uniref:MFS transporter n=1 Tax=Pseudomonas aeruginosa group TaxID=136841 RepID=UPI0005BD81E2|nr:MULTISPECIES: MFS transporter [Pseudomonas aeruginosa group]MDK2351770.1 MFS transporter [Pseudomonas paraeruginosa]MEA8483214.1 MFS transporter [Pseudomonas aeruginosa]
MTSLSPPLAQATPSTPTAPVAQPFGARIVIGLLGVLLASLSAGLNGHVTEIAMTDVRGALAIGHDEGTWLTVLYEATQVAAMAFAPWCSVTFSLRRFTLFAIGGFALLALLCPFAPNLESLLALRTLQGLMAGCLPPMLMTVALRFLPPGIKLYGLGAYALTATFGPNLGLPLAAFWFEYVGWQWVFWQVIPLCLVAMAAVSYGIPQDPVRLERFRQFDGIGLLTGFPAICALVIGLLQGERLDWFESPLIGLLLGGGSLLLVLFLVNEWSHPLPFFRLQLLKRRNLTFALITLAGVLVVLGASLGVPTEFLAEIRGYRPLQSVPMVLLLALPQLVALPLVAALCNIPRVDCRWVLACGLCLCGGACLSFSQLTADWVREDFYLPMLLLVVGQPMAVIPLLMLSTSVIAPIEGPFASAWFNTVRGFSGVAATAVIGALGTAREHYHSNRLVDHLGNATQAVELRLQQIAGLQPGADSAAHWQHLAEQARQQAQVLANADVLMAMAGLACALLILIPILPQRAYPPRPVAPTH